MYEDILSQFDLHGKAVLVEPYGNGHINWTYLVRLEDGSDYILQKINTYVFKNPVGLMRNIELLTDFLRPKADDPREVMELIPTKSGTRYICTENGEYWRMYTFVKNSVCYDSAPSLDLFSESGAAFGRFQNNLADFPVEQLVETIPDFHNTVARYGHFDDVVAENPRDRLKTALPEVEFLLERRDFASFLSDKVAAGVIPMRVTHNDTKINNVLFDKDTNRGLCVIDLDTTMPGYSALDFGDSIRYAGNNAAEDEKDLSKVFLKLDHFEAYAKGFCGTCKRNLTPDELLVCPEGAKLITLETGLRFLTDYIEGDVYFHTAYPEHNLVRARTQFALVADMEKKMPQMKGIIEKILES